MDQKKIGMFLKELRKQKGITQEGLAEALSVSTDRCLDGKRDQTCQI